MSLKKRGLGKGLSELGLSELLSELSTPTTMSVKNPELIHLPVERLKSGKYQPRRDMAPQALQELADSIRTQGIIQPIVVRQTENGDYEIIAGERRWRAAQMAGLLEVPTIVRSINDETALAMSLIENIQRQNLNVIEEADALNRLIQEFNMTHHEVAMTVGKSRASVTNVLRLLKLNSDVRALVEKGHLDMGHARALLALEDQRQSDVANLVVARALSVRDTEKLVNRLLQHQNDKRESAVISDPDIARLEKNLADRLGAKVFIRHTDKGKGKLVINYHSLEQLDGILSLMA